MVQKEGPSGLGANEGGRDCSRTKGSEAVPTACKRTHCGVPIGKRGTKKGTQTHPLLYEERGKEKFSKREGEEATGLGEIEGG